MTEKLFGVMTTDEFIGWIKRRAAHKELTRWQVRGESVGSLPDDGSQLFDIKAWRYYPEDKES